MKNKFNKIESIQIITLKYSAQHVKSLLSAMLTNSWHDDLS